jgi:hypothetical protein
VLLIYRRQPEVAKNIYVVEHKQRAGPYVIETFVNETLTSATESSAKRSSGLWSVNRGVYELRDRDVDDGRSGDAAELRSVYACPRTWRTKVRKHGVGLGYVPVGVC